MSKKELGTDFEKVLQKANEIPEVSAQLNSFSNAVANLVFSRRLQLGLTQTRLAEMAETTQATISRIEAGDAGVKLEAASYL